MGRAAKSCQLPPRGSLYGASTVPPSSSMAWASRVKAAGWAPVPMASAAIPRDRGSAAARFFRRGLADFGSATAPPSTLTFDRQTIVDLAHTGKRLCELFGQKLGIWAVYRSDEGDGATLHLNLDLSGIELRIIGQDLVDLARETLVRPPAEGPASAARAFALLLSPFGLELLLAPGLLARVDEPLLTPCSRVGARTVTLPVSIAGRILGGSFVGVDAATECAEAAFATRS